MKQMVSIKNGGLISLNAINLLNIRTFVFICIGANLGSYVIFSLIDPTQNTAARWDIGFGNAKVLGLWTYLESQKN